MDVDFDSEINSLSTSSAPNTVSMLVYYILDKCEGSPQNHDKKNMKAHPGYLRITQNR